MKFGLGTPAMMIVFLLPGVAGKATAASSSGIHSLAAVPVLPLPQHIETYRTESGPPVTAGSLLGKGLTPAAKERLLFHWSGFLKEFAAGGPAQEKPDVVEIGILGKDGSFDKAVAQWASPWSGRIGKEGYLLILRNRKRFIAAHTETGLFYGIQSLKQLIRAGWKGDLFIADWPSFETRVIYDDISRGPISTVAYIKKQIERMAEIKINYLSFYIEHIVQPRSHPDFAPPDGKLTTADITELSAYAAKFHMQLIGSFQSFGHFEKILSLPQYASMGATSTLISPTDPRAKQFLEEVIGELCGAFNAPWFNVNCDETFDLGQGSTKPLVDSLGAVAVYASHLRFLYDIVKRHGKKMMMWGDFAVKHPEVLDRLPRDIVYLTWEYGDQSSFDHWIKPFANRHLNYMICPGILNSYRMFPDMQLARANITGFTKAGHGQAAKGVITTVWDDGAVYLFSSDWYGVYVAAERSWTVDSTAVPSFNTRYEQTAYGTRNGDYVKALFTLMELKKLPLTYDLSDRVWQQKILPDSGKKLIVNNTGVVEAGRIVGEAEHYIRSSDPKRNQTDISTLANRIALYKLILDTRLKTVAIAADYTSAAAGTPQQAGVLFTRDIKETGDLIQAYTASRETFRQAWLKENQHYWLDSALTAYDKKINRLTRLRETLKQ
ncbi:MAG TPA: glycoside hydrolase family 20 zincin-like fold domain-containing protein, partial [Puia sp.]